MSTDAPSRCEPAVAPRPLPLRRRFYPGDRPPPPLGLIALLGVCNRIAIPVLTFAGWVFHPIISIPLAILWVASLLAEPVLTSIFAVLGPGRSLPRWLAVMAVEAGLLVTLAGPIVVFERLTLGPDLLMLVALAPLASLAVKVPLLPLRLLWGLHLSWRGAAADTEDVRQFGIAHMLAALTFVAVALGLAQWGAGRETDGSLGIYFVVGMAFLIGLFIAVPCALFGLLTERSNGCAMMIAYFFVIWVFGCAWGFSPFAPDFVAYGSVIPLMTPGCAGAMLALWFARSLGYEMRRPQRTLPAADDSRGPFD